MTSIITPECLQDDAEAAVCGGENAYRVWTIANGRDFRYFAHGVVSADNALVPIFGWSVTLSPSGDTDTEVVVRAVQSNIRHRLHGSRFDSAREAFSALFDAGVAGIRVPESSTVRVRAWHRVGSGYGPRHRILVLDYRVPPPEHVHDALEEAFALSLPLPDAETALGGEIDERHLDYLRRGYRPLEDGDLIAYGDTFFEITPRGWRKVRMAEFVDTAPATMLLIDHRVFDDEVADDDVALAFEDLTGGHTIGLDVTLPLTLGPIGWQIPTSAVDGEAVDIAGQGNHRTSCGTATFTCDPHAHQAAAQRVAARVPRPTGAEIAPLINAAVLQADDARADHSNGRAKRLYDLAVRSVDTELGEAVLAMFGEMPFPGTRREQPRVQIDRDGTRILRFSPDAYAVLCGRNAGVDQVDRGAARVPREVEAELAQALPVYEFHRWDAASDEDSMPGAPGATT